VQHDLVWSFIESHLPVLLSEVEALLVVPPADTGRTGK
jgi:hypothetical protein